MVRGVGGKTLKEVNDKRCCDVDDDDRGVDAPVWEVGRLTNDSGTVHGDVWKVGPHAAGLAIGIAAAGQLVGVG